MKSRREQVPSRFWLSSDLEICVHEFEYLTTGFDALPHTHAEFNITFCLDQNLEYDIEGKLERLGPGEVIAINPGQLHFGRYGNGSVAARGVTLHISERAIRSLLAQMHMVRENDECLISFSGKAHSPMAVHLVREMIQELEKREQGYEILVRSLIPQVLVHLFRDALTPTLSVVRRDVPRQLPSWQMVQALEYMNSRGKSEFSLAELCSRIGSSPSRFIRLFTTSANASPHTFYNLLVISKAQELLRTETYSIKEVAYQLGFQNDAHFCTVFRQLCGVTPKAFRMLEPPQNGAAGLPR